MAYSEDSFDELERAVLKRPGMYVGDLDWRGFYHILSDAIRVVCDKLPQRTAPRGYCLDGHVVLFVNLAGNELSLRFDINEIVVSHDVDFAGMSAGFYMNLQNLDPLTNIALLAAISKEFSILAGEGPDAQALFRKKSAPPQSVDLSEYTRVIELKMTLLPLWDLTELNLERFETMCFAATREFGALIAAQVRIGDEERIWWP